MGNFDPRVSNDCILLFNVISSGPFLPHPLNQFLFVKVLEMPASHIVLLLILFVESQQFLAAGKVIFLRSLDGCGGLLLFFHALGKLVHLTLVLVHDFLLFASNFSACILDQGEFTIVCLFLSFLKSSNGFGLFFKLLNVLDKVSDVLTFFFFLTPQFFNSLQLLLQTLRTFLQQDLLLGNLESSDFFLAPDLSSRFLFQFLLNKN